MKLLLLLLILLFFLGSREKFVEVNNKMIVKNIDGSNKLFIFLADYNNIDIARLFSGSIKLKILIPENYKAIITYRYDDRNREFAFNLELPDGEYILERNVRKTMIDKIIITNVRGDVTTSLILAKNENGGVIYTTSRDKMINWEAIKFAPNRIKTVYGSNAMLPIYYNPPNNPINVRRIPHTHILPVARPAPRPAARPVSTPRRRR
jgi:hypothetical protein